eukprot:m.288801 g.288801  ORF g.288801 m.288801 type:complete len:95 (-) comp27101_c0_seq8:1168-1452(-)
MNRRVVLTLPDARTLVLNRYFAALIERLGIRPDADPCAFTAQPLFAPIMADMESACHLYMDILKTEVCRCPPPTPYASSRKKPRLVEYPVAARK